MLRLPRCRLPAALVRTRNLPVARTIAIKGQPMASMGSSMVPCKAGVNDKLMARSQRALLWLPRAKHEACSDAMQQA